ncbi:MAG: hypothetical protein K5697_05290 [Lachnospiraceae bacterium]|nr:hypothetical protein [Lachnospiraceae bacterium]
MLNESRIKLMTRLAAFETGEGKKSMAIGTYFRGDYIAKEIIKSVIYGTITFVVLLGVYLAYDLEKFMENIYEMDLWAFGKDILYRYVLLIIIYAAVTYVVYVVRYRRARRNLRVYYNNLRRLGSMYRKEMAGAQQTAERVRP